MSEIEGPFQPSLVDRNSKEKILYTREQLVVEFRLPKELERSPSEHEMIDAAASILCGEEVSSFEIFEFAKRYLAALMEKPNIEEERRSFEEREKYVDQDLTSALQALMGDTTPESILYGQRAKVVGPDGEKPFEVRVLKPVGYDEMIFDQKKVAWVSLTGSPDMFATRNIDLPDNTSILYLSPEQAKQLLTAPTDRDEGSAKRAFEHEYRHSQRSFVSKNDRLFRILDESCTNVGSFYGYLRAMLTLLGLTTENLRFRQALNAYESGDENAKGQFLKSFRENFGAEGLLLLGAKPSSEHAPDDGITDLPLVSIDGVEKYPDLHFLETLLTKRAQKEAQWKTLFETNLSGAEISRAGLEGMKGFHLGRYFQGKETPGIQFVGEIQAAIDTEIQRRTVAGEKGFYDNIPPLKKFTPLK